LAAFLLPLALGRVARIKPLSFSHLPQVSRSGNKGNRPTAFVVGLRTSWSDMPHNLDENAKGRSFAYF
jgi:hypothetical protein